MDRRRGPQRRIGNRNPTQTENNGKNGTSGVRRRRLVNRRNRRVGQRVNRRNRLERAQGALRSNRRNGRRGRLFQYRRRNYRLRKVFVGGLVRSVNNRELYRLFRIEGRLINWRISYDRNRRSRGFGEIEFANPRDAWRAIRKWNGTYYKGLLLRVEYRRRPRRMNNRGFGYSRGYNNRGYYGNQNRGGYRGFGGNRRGGRNYY